MTDALSLQTPPALPFNVEHNCTSSIVACFIACEDLNCFLKVVTYALAFFVTVALMVSIVGNILLFKLVEEYTAQTFESQLSKAPKPDGERITALETQKAEAQAQVTQLREGLDTATRQAEESLNKKEEELAQAKAALSERSEEARQLLIKLGTARDKAAQTDTQLQSAQHDLQTAHTSLAQLQQQYFSLEAQHSATESQCSGLQQRITHIEAQRVQEQERSDQALLQIRTELFTATSAREALAAEALSLTESLASEQLNVRTLTSELAQEREEHSTLKAGSKKTTLAFSENLFQLHVVENQKNEANDRITKLEDALRNAENGIKERIAALQDQLQKTTAERDSVSLKAKELDIQLSRLRKELEDARESALTQTALKLAAQNKIPALEARIRELQAEHSAYVEELTQLREQLGKIAATHDSFSADALKKLEAYKEDSTDKSDVLLKDLHNSLTAQGKLAQSNLALGVQLESEKMTASGLRERLAGSAKLLEETEARIEELNKDAMRLEVVQSQLGGAKAELAPLQAQVARLKEERDSLNQEFAKLQQSTTQALLRRDEQLQKVQSANTERLARISQLGADLLQAQSAIGALKAQHAAEQSHLTRRAETAEDHNARAQRTLLSLGDERERTEKAKIRASEEHNLAIERLQKRCLQLAQELTEERAQAAKAAGAFATASKEMGELREQLRQAKHALLDATQNKQQLERRIILERMSPRKQSPATHVARPQMFSPVRHFTLDAIPEGTERRSKPASNGFPTKEQIKALLGDSPTRPAPQVIPGIGAGAGAQQPVISAASGALVQHRSSPPMPTRFPSSFTAQQAVNRRAEMSQALGREQQENGR